jgi:RimJ/RimL family protein N-acetyltransferase
MVIPELETERLVLRGFRESDLPAYAAICADPEVARFMGNGKPLSAQQVRQQADFLRRHWELRGYGIWAVARRDSGRVIGRAGFHNPEGWPRFELGWVIARELWGRGFATEAARVALRHGFRDLNRDHVISLIRPGNFPSIRVAEKIGETLEGKGQLDGRAALIYGVRREKRSAA